MSEDGEGNTVRVELKGTIRDLLKRETAQFELLTNLRFRRGLDLDSLLILSAFNVAGLSGYRSETNFRDGISVHDFHARLSATTISDMTGIPRQTVRRRLASLADKGYLTASEDGGYAMTRHWQGPDLLSAWAGQDRRPPQDQAAPASPR